MIEFIKINDDILWDVEPWSSPTCHPFPPFYIAIWEYAKILEKTMRVPQYNNPDRNWIGRMEANRIATTWRRGQRAHSERNGEHETPCEQGHHRPGKEPSCWHQQLGALSRVGPSSHGTRDKVLSYYVQWTQALCRLGAMDHMGKWRHSHIHRPGNRQPPWEHVQRWPMEAFDLVPQGDWRPCGATMWNVQFREVAIFGRWTGPETYWNHSVLIWYIWYIAFTKEPCQIQETLQCFRDRKRCGAGDLQV